MNDYQRQVIANCQKSVTWFLTNFGKVKHPVAGSLPFVPFKYQQHALKTFRQNRFVIFRKCRQCFAGDQMVWTPHGPQRIDSIKPGNSVYSYNQTTGLLEVRPVQQVYANGEADCVEVRTKTGHRSICTPDHEFFTRLGEVKAGSLTPNDVLLEVNEPERYGKSPDESEVILLGYLLTDGHYRKCIHFTNTNWKYLLEYQKHYQRRFGGRARIKYHGCGQNGNGKKAYRIATNRTVIKKWLQSLNIYGHVGGSKEIPECVFRWNNQAIALLLNRMFAADGWYSFSNCNEVGIGQLSVKMIHQIKQLLSRFGISCKIYPPVNDKLTRLRILDGPDFAKFVEYIGIFGKEPRSQITKGFFFNRKKGSVLSVKPVADTKQVYDLKVGPNDNYIVDGVVVHNCGISKISGAYALWYAMFFPLKTVLIVSRTDPDAMSFLEDNVRFLFRNLPDWMQDMWNPTKDNEHEIKFPNGSVIKSKTSHPDVMRSNASSLNIIDEAAFIQNMGNMWAAAWPTMQSGGSAIVVSTCVNPDTYVLTNRGFQQIKDFEPASLIYDYKSGYEHATVDADIVASNGKLVKATAFYKREPEDTKKIVTKCGYALEASTRHRVNTALGYKYVDELSVGDYLPIIIGHRRWGNDDYAGFADHGWDKCPTRNHPTSLTIDTITTELAYLLGIILAEGNLCDTYVVVTNGDAGVLRKFLDNSLGIKWIQEDRKTHIRCCSTRFVRFLKWFGFKQCRAWEKEIPSRLWSCSEEIVAAFLSGMYDGDGHSRIRDGEVGYSTTSRRLKDQLRLLLSNFGLVCREEYRGPYTKDFTLNNREYTSECRESWQLIIRSGHARLFYDLIGFGLERKQNNSLNCRPEIEYVPAIDLIREFRRQSGLSISNFKSIGIHQSILHGRVDRPLKAVNKATVIALLDATRDRFENLEVFKKLEDMVSPNIYWDTIESLENGFSEVMDFTIPETSNFWSNAFDSHNTNGVGGWYWSTYTDAQVGENDFVPLDIMWWDMDWVVEYDDPLSGKHVRLAPRDGIRKCTTQAEIDKYGPYWSPWLEIQYKGLQEKGETWKFQQEVLASFVGSGNNVIDKSVLTFIETTVSDKFDKIITPQTYVHPASGEKSVVDFTPPAQGQGWYIWDPPFKGSTAKRQGSTIIEPGMEPYTYIAGLDLATGKGADFNALEILCLETQSQVAEFMIHCKPRELKYMVDYICRYYNNALLVIERNNGGDSFVDEMRLELGYPRLWRKKSITNNGNRSSVSYGEYGFYTGPTGKPLINKLLINHIRNNKNDGFVIKSRRLHKQLQIYVRKKDQSGKDTDKTEAETGPGNHDDLVMALGLALVGLQDAGNIDPAGMMPFKLQPDIQRSEIPDLMHNDDLLTKAGPGFAFPVKVPQQQSLDVTAQEEIMQYAAQLGGFIGIDRMKMPAVKKPRKYFP